MSSKKILRILNNRDSVLSLTCDPILDKKRNVLIPVRVVLQPGWNNISDDEIASVTNVLKVPLAKVMIEKGLIVVEDAAKKNAKAQTAELKRQLAKMKKDFDNLSGENATLKKELEEFDALSKTGTKK